MHAHGEVGIWWFIKEKENERGKLRVLE